MPTRKHPRKGSLQFWPRKRARKLLPSVNWDAIDSDDKLKGFIGYKAGMVSVYVKDNTEHSRMKGKGRVIPGTLIEIPPMKIFSVRFYKNGIPQAEIVSESLDKELKKKLKLPKTKKKIESVKTEEFDDIRLICYSVVKKTGLKKTPDLLEFGLSGNYEDKIAFAKENLTKEINPLEFFKKGELVDVRGLTTGRGFSGPVRRFGIQLKNHKSEKGQRRPGSIGPWHPARVTFRVPMAGQLGMFSRIVYNNKILDLGLGKEKFKNLKNYGNVNTNYILIAGSVQGPVKRQVVITKALRPTKKQSKKEYEFVELR